MLVMGGVLLEAKKQSFINAVKPLLDQIFESAGFYLSLSVYNRILQYAGEAT
jgi:predicted nucleic acid-binding protein